jgi:hypothetical protein
MRGEAACGRSGEAGPIGLAVLYAAAALSTAAVAAPLTASQLRAIDAAAAKALKATGVPAASIAVVRDGQIVYAHAYGLQRAGVPATAGARYKIASISKQFTAAAVLLLAEDGKLSLDDPVGGEAAGYLSENRIYPDDRAAIVVLDNADFGNAQTSIADAIEKALFTEAGDVSRAKAIFKGLRAGKIDRSQFTANGNHYFTPEALADYRTSLSALGEPKGFTRISSSLRGGFTAEAYKVDYGVKTLTVILRAEPGPKGRIEQFTVYPAE